MECHFCKTKVGKIDLLKYGKVTIPVCATCSYWNTEKDEDENV